MEIESAKKARIMEMVSNRYDQWSSSQQGQTDAYSFEESYVKFMDDIGQEMLQEIVGHERDSRKKNDKL